MPKSKKKKKKYFSDLEKSYEDSKKGWENYLRDITLGTLYEDPDLDLCPRARGHVRGALDYLAAEIGPEKALAKVYKLLDWLEDSERCSWIEMHRAGMIKTEGKKLASRLLRGDVYDEPMH